MGLRSAHRREGAPKRGGVRSVECIIGSPLGIEELPSQTEEPGERSLECGMGQRSAERRN